MHLAAPTVSSSGCRDKAIAGSRDSDLAGLTLEERNSFLLGESFGTPPSCLVLVKVLRLQITRTQFLWATAKKGFIGNILVTDSWGY